jgi:hypothetical protein
MLPPNLILAASQPSSPKLRWFAANPKLRDSSRLPLNSILAASHPLLCKFFFFFKKKNLNLEISMHGHEKWLLYLTRTLISSLIPINLVLNVVSTSHEKKMLILTFTEITFNYLCRLYFSICFQDSNFFFHCHIYG